MCLCWLSNTDALGSLEQEYRLVSWSTFTTALEYRRHADDKVKFSTFNSVDFWTFRLVVTQSVDVVGPVWTCLNNALQSAAMTEFVVVLSSSRQTRSCFSELCCKSPRSKACHCKVCNYTLWHDVIAVGLCHAYVHLRHIGPGHTSKTYTATRVSRYEHIPNISFRFQLAILL